MLDRDAKPKTANRIDVGYIPIERIDNMAGALFGDSTVQRKYLVKLSFIITAARPANIGQVNIIRNIGTGRAACARSPPAVGFQMQCGH